MRNLLYYSEESLKPTSLAQFELSDVEHDMSGNFIEVASLPCGFDELCKSWRVVDKQLVFVGNPPGEFHTWNPQTQSWSVDVVLARKLLSVMIPKKRQAMEFSGFRFMGSKVQSDQQSQIRLQSLLAYSSVTDASLSWKLEDNTVVVLSGEDFVKINIALAEHLQMCHAKVQDWKQRIQLAEDEGYFLQLLCELRI